MAHSELLPPPEAVPGPERPGGPGAPTAAPTWDLLLLGRGLQVRAGARTVGLSPRGQQVLALLALRVNLDRSQVAGTLWEDSSEERALASLRTELWRLNRQLPGAVVCDGRRVRLGSGVQVDVDDVVRRGRRVLDRSVALDLDDVPPPWESGDLLPGWGHPWLTIDRERLRQLRLHVGEVAALRLCELGHFALALDSALGVLRIEPTRESAYRTLIAVHVAEGNLAEARRTFARCAAVLRRELGTAPTFTLDVTGRTRPAAPGPRTPRSARRPARAAPGPGSR